MKSCPVEAPRHPISAAVLRLHQAARLAWGGPVSLASPLGREHLGGQSQCTGLPGPEAASPPVPPVDDVCVRQSEPAPPAQLSAVIAHLSPREEPSP